MLDDLHDKNIRESIKIHVPYLQDINPKIEIKKWLPKPKAPITPEVKEKILTRVKEEINKYYDPKKENASIRELAREYNIGYKSITRFAQEEYPEDYEIIWRSDPVPSEVKEKMLEVLQKEVNKFLREYYELLYSFDILKLNKLTSNKKDLQNKIYSLMQTRKGAEAILLNHLTSLLIKTSDFSASFMALNTD